MHNAALVLLQNRHHLQRGGNGGGVHNTHELRTAPQAATSLESPPSSPLPPPPPPANHLGDIIPPLPPLGRQRGGEGLVSGIAPAPPNGRPHSLPTPWRGSRRAWRRPAAWTLGHRVPLAPGGPCGRWRKVEEGGRKVHQRLGLSAIVSCLLTAPVEGDMGVRVRAPPSPLA